MVFLNQVLMQSESLYFSKDILFIFFILNRKVLPAPHSCHNGWLFMCFAQDFKISFHYIARTVSVYTY